MVSACKQLALDWISYCYKLDSAAQLLRSCCSLPHLPGSLSEQQESMAAGHGVPDLQRRPGRLELWGLSSAQHALGDHHELGRLLESCLKRAAK